MILGFFFYVNKKDYNCKLIHSLYTFEIISIIYVSLFFLIPFEKSQFFIIKNNLILKTNYS